MDHELVLLPDFEQIVRHYLAAREEVAEIVGDRIYTVLSAVEDADEAAEESERPPFPLVRLVRLPSAPLDANPRWVDRALFNFDFYGGPKKLAFTLGQTVLAALDAPEFIGVHEIDGIPAGVITGVEWGQFGWLPDTEFTPAQPRYVATAAVIGHPAPLVSS